MNEKEITNLMGQRIRLRYQTLVGQDEPYTHAEGQLIAYAAEPTVVILTDDGRQVSWLARLAEKIPDPGTEQVAELRKRVEEAISDPQNWGRSLDGSDHYVLDGSDHYVDARSILAALYPKDKSS